MNYDVEIYKLSNDFFNDYPISKYPELLIKDGRPYNCLLIDTHIDYFICVPFRTNISSHNNDSYKFKNSNRSKQHISGLDYQKMLIIKESRYLENNAVVDRDEYSEAMENIKQSIVKLVRFKENVLTLQTFNPICPAGRAGSRWSPISLYRIEDLKKDKPLLMKIKISLCIEVYN